MQITDRSKDVIKSGGEWISSIDIENIAMAHPAVREAACIALPHPKWDERPLLVVVNKPGAEVTRDGCWRIFEGKVAKWQVPDDVVFLDAHPARRHRQDAEEQAARDVPRPSPARGLSGAASQRPAPAASPRP